MEGSTNDQNKKVELRINADSHKVMHSNRSRIIRLHKERVINIVFNYGHRKSKDFKAVKIKVRHLKSVAEICHSDMVI